MPKHPAWNQYEAALLHDICLRVARGEIPKEAAMQKLSEKLRRKAGRNDDNDTYRDKAGISWQYNDMSALITRPGYKRGSKVFHEIARLYREEPEKYARILWKAKRMVARPFSVE